MSSIDPKDVELNRARMQVDDVRASLGGLLRGRRAVITGVANDRSIAWAIAQAFHQEGAELVFTYAGEMMEKRVRPHAESMGAKAILDAFVGLPPWVQTAVLTSWGLNKLTGGMFTGIVGELGKITAPDIRAEAKKRAGK